VITASTGRLSVAGKDLPPRAAAPVRYRLIAVQHDAPPYDDCFYAALESHGVRVIAGSLSGRWLVKNVKAGDYVHLQFPSFVYAGAPTRLGLLFGFTRFVALLLLVRLRRAKLLWTAHNLMPHDATPFPYLDRLGRKIVIALSHRVFVHGPSAARALEERFRGVHRKLVVIHFGHWLDYYPRAQSRADARAQLGLSRDAHVFLFIGLCKPYKNLHGLIETFRRRSGASLLLIAGRFQSDDYRERIAALAEGDDRIRLYPRHIPDAELQTFLGACDCVVLPYLQTLTSGAAMLALSFGRPVVSVKRGSLQDVITDEVGILFEPSEPDGLERALQAAAARRFDDARILAHARRFTWTSAARAFADALEH